MTPKSPPPGSHERQGRAGSDPDAAPWRVYVSGFLDWPRQADEVADFDPWRCANNPSGYLLVGRWHEGGAKPDPTRGPLPRALRGIRRTRDGRAIEWSFDVLPTRWGIAEKIPAHDHDVIVSLGLGVYPERFGDAYERTILVELGARNLRARGPDVAGVSIGEAGAPSGLIDPGRGRVLTPPARVARRAREAVSTVTVGGAAYSVIAEAARDENAFVCNETHYTLLSHVGSGPRPRQAYFIHLPRPRNMQRGRPLTKALTSVIEGLVQP
jgi:hypothetical protein